MIDVTLFCTILFISVFVLLPLSIVLGKIEEIKTMELEKELNEQGLSMFR